MVRFDEMMDDIISKTKSAAKVAGQKTTELVEMGKLKYQEQAISRDVNKAYAKLGAIVYEAKENGEDLNGLIDMTIDELKELNQKLDDVEKQMTDAVDSFKKPAPQEEPEEEFGITVPWEDGLEEAKPEAEAPIVTPEEEQHINSVTVEVDEIADELSTHLNANETQE